MTNVTEQSVHSWKAGHVVRATRARHGYCAELVTATDHAPEGSAGHRITYIAQRIAGRKIRRMLQFVLAPVNQAFCIQWMTSPSVYLDHWALMDISGDAALAQRFISAIKTRNGMLVLSEFNRGEFAGVTDVTQALAVELLMTAAAPNLFFINCNWLDVGMRETEAMQGTPLPAGMNSACDDVRLLRMLTAHVKDFRVNVEGLFQLVSCNGAQIKANRVPALETYRAYIAEQRKSRDAYRAALARWRRRFKKEGTSRKHAAGVLGTRLLGDLIKSTRPINDHDANDFLHACVPCAYCDIVLLDNHWRTNIEKVRREYGEYPTRPHLARVFSKGGMKDFFTALEAYPIMGQPMPAQPTVQ